MLTLYASKQNYSKLHLKIFVYFSLLLMSACEFSKEVCLSYFSLCFGCKWISLMICIIYT